MHYIDVGFKDNQDLADHILKNLAASQSDYDRICTGDKKSKEKRCLYPRPRWVCAAIFDSEEFFYDYTEKNDPHFRGMMEYRLIVLCTYFKLFVSQVAEVSRWIADRALGASPSTSRRETPLPWLPSPGS